MGRPNSFLKPVKAAIFRHWGRYLMWLFSSPLTLTLNRCTRKDVLLAVKKARTGCPGASVYVLSDADLPPIPGTHRINAVKDLLGAPIPSAVVLACNSDELAFEAVKFIKERDGMFYYGAHRVIPAARYFHRDETALKVLLEAGRANLDRYDMPDLENIIQAIHATRSVEGDYVEIGVYKGSSAYCALSYLERTGIQRRSYFLDTFSGFDYDRAASSADRAWYKTHGEASDEFVRNRLARFQIPHQVVKANIITDALPPEIKKIAVCNIDVDMYEAVAAALAKVAPLMVEGGIIIAEDQGHTPLLIGAYAATKEFLESPAGRNFVPIEMLSGQMFLIKTRGTGN